MVTSSASVSRFTNAQPPSGLARLGAARQAALNRLGIGSLQELMASDLLRSARLVAAAARGTVPANQVSGLLTAEFSGRAVADAPGWPLTALRQVGAQALQQLNTIGITDIAALVQLGNEAEAAVLAGLEDNGFLERPSAPAALLPGLIGSVASSVRFASFIRDTQLRDLGFVIDRDCAPDLPLSAIVSLQGSQISLADALALLKAPRTPRQLADLVNQLAKVKTASELAALIERLAGKATPVGGQLSDIFEQQRCPVFQLGYLCGHRQQWINLGTHLGEVVHSLSLAPGESRNIAFVNWQRRQQTAASQQTQVQEQLTANFVQNRALEEITSSVAREHQGGGSSTQANTAATAVGVVGALAVGTGLGAAIGTAVATPGVGTAVGAAIGLGVSGVLAAGAVFSSAQALGTIEADTSGSRNIAAQVQQRISLSTSQRASAVRSLWSTSVVEDVQAEQVQATTSNITNYNHMHALNMQYYEVLQHYLTRMDLEVVEPLLYLPFTHFDFSHFRFVRDYWHVVRQHLGDDSLVAQGDSYFVTEKAPQSPDLVPVPPRLDVRNGRLRDVKLQVAFVYSKRITIKLAIRAGQTTIEGQEDAIATAGTVRFRNFSFPGVIPAGNEVQVIVSIDRSDGGRVKLSLSALQATAENDEQRLQLDDTPVGTVNVADSHLKKNYTVRWDIPDLEPRHAALEQAKNAKEIARAQATNEARQQAFDSLNDDIQRFEERLQRQVLRRRHLLTRVILNATEPEEIQQLLEAVALREGTTGAGIPLGRLADTTPVGMTTGAFVLKLKRLDATQAASVAADAGVDLQQSPDLAVLLSYADDVCARFEQQQQIDPVVRMDHVYVPTAGLFAEAVLGRSNSAEYLDMERYFNWQDSPIPNAASAIAPVSTDSRFQRGDVNVNVPEGNLQVINPVTLPDPTGLQNVLAAIQNGNLFRDMSKTSELAGVISSLSTLSASIGQAAAGMTGQAAQDAVKTAGQLAQKAAELAQSQASSASLARTPTETGQLLGTASNIDQEIKKAAEQAPTAPTSTSAPTTPAGQAPNPLPGPSLRQQTFRKVVGLAPPKAAPSLRQAMFIFQFNNEKSVAVDGTFEIKLRMDGLGADGQTPVDRSTPLVLNAVFDKGLFQQEITLGSQPAPLSMTFAGCPLRTSTAVKDFQSSKVFAPLPPDLLNYVFTVSMVVETIEVEASSKKEAVDAVTGAIDFTVTGEDDKVDSTPPGGAPANPPATPPKKKPKFSKKPTLTASVLSMLSSLVDVSAKISGGITDTNTQTDGTVLKFVAKMPTGGLLIELDRTLSS